MESPIETLAMLTAFLVWADVSGIEDRKGAFPGHGSSMLMHLSQHSPASRHCIVTQV